MKKYLPQLVTPNTILNQQNLKDNINRIFEIIRQDQIIPDEFIDAHTMILNIMKSITRGLDYPSNFMTIAEVLQNMKTLNEIIAEILDRDIESKLQFVT